MSLNEDRHFSIVFTVFQMKEGESGKPDSVMGNHSSRRHITGSLKRITTENPCRESLGSNQQLASDGVYNTLSLLSEGSLLKRALSAYPNFLGGMLSIALSVALRPPEFLWHLSL